MNEAERLHEETLLVAKTYLRCEKRIIECLIRNEETKAFVTLGYSSLHVYCTKALGLSDAVAYSLTGIARTSRQIPEVKTLIDENKLTISNATQIMRVISQDNKTDLLELAQNNSKRELEKKLKVIFPEKLPQERIRPLTESLDELKIVLNSEMKEALLFLKDHYSKKAKRNLTLSETVESMTKELRDRHDPVKKAERSVTKKSVDKKPLEATASKEAIPVTPPFPATNSNRITYSASLRHQINLRDGAQCTFYYPNGERCVEKRWLNFHHVVPLSDGGPNTIENLTTLCVNHHSYIHEHNLQPRQTGNSKTLNF